MKLDTEKANFSDFINDMMILKPVVYENKLLIFDMNHKKELLVNHKMLPLKSEAFSFLFVIYGEINITIDYVPYTIGANSFCMLTDRHIINSMSTSRDFEGVQITVVHDYLISKIKVTPPPPSPKGKIFPRIKPIITIGRTDFKILLDIIEKLHANILREGHYYQQKLVENELSNLMCEMWNFMAHSDDNEVRDYTPNTHEELTTNFFRLIIENGKKEHEVTFYANELNVTPVYLSRAIKSTTGKTAIKLISDFILIEAKVMLRQPRVNIQEVAENLNFSDQASFSKFFKKHTGESPSNYKKDIA